MFVFDIIILGILAFAFLSGLRSGIAVQLGGLAGLFLGVYFAYRFGETLGTWLGFTEEMSFIAGFIIIVVGVVLLVVLLSRILRGVIKLTGLGMLDRIGGGILSLLKTTLILGLLIYGFSYVNNTTKWVPQQQLDRSFIYGTMISAAEFSFPYLETARELLIPLYNNEP